MACRNVEKGEEAAQGIRTGAAGAKVEVASLDLASLDSVRGFAKDFLERHGGLDLLISNAGIMAPPRSATADGFEMQFGTNHLGHFALTGLLLESMREREDGRVVTVSSTAHRMGKISFDDLQGERRYSRWRAYGQSKLANLLFMFELERHLVAAGWPIRSVAAHPGYAATHLQSTGPPLIETILMKVSNAVIAQSAEMGALPTLFAATAPGVEGGSFIGPGGMGQQRGHPAFVVPNQASRDEQVAERLWGVSEELTGVQYPV